MFITVYLLSSQMKLINTIKALAELASIFKLKLQQTLPHTPPAAPPTVKKRTCLSESSNPILASPMPTPRQTRSQTKIHTHAVQTCRCQAIRQGHHNHQS
jgi:hypothetical protein